LATHPQAYTTFASAKMNPALLARNVKERPLMRFRISTYYTFVFVAGVLYWLNIRGAFKDEPISEWGWPCTIVHKLNYHSKYVSTLKITVGKEMEFTAENGETKTVPIIALDAFDLTRLSVDIVVAVAIIILFIGIEKHLFNRSVKKKDPPS